MKKPIIKGSCGPSTTQSTPRLIATRSTAPLPEGYYEDETSYPWSKSEKKFIAAWTKIGGPYLEREYKFHPVRKWRVDFIHHPSRTVIEVEGAVFVRGGHSTGKGITRDCEKGNALTEGGFYLWRFTTGMCLPEILQPCLNFIRSKTPTIPNPKQN